MTDANRVLNIILDMGCKLMECNAEIHRIEDTLSRMGKAYGARDMNVFAITSCIIVTMTLPSGECFTQTRRIENPGTFNFEKLEELNKISRDYAKKHCSLDKLEARLVQIDKLDEKTTRRTTLIEYIGSGLAAGAFSMFFGGHILDGTIGFLVGLFTCFTQNFVKKVAPNKLIFQLLNALIIGVLIGFLGKFLPLINTDKIMIGDIMLLIPGVAMTNSLKDMLAGDIIFGVFRFIETLMWACALAAGFMISMLIMQYM